MSLKIILLIGHLIGMALGAGGATLSDVLFLTSVRDNLIDRSELRLLKAAARVVIAGLALLTVTGIGFFFTDSQPSERFWAKLTIVGIAALNGYWLHRQIFPLFERCAQQQRPLFTAHTSKYAWRVVSAGCISAVSWYAALTLGVWRSTPFSYWEILGGYLGIVVTALLFANLGLYLLMKWRTVTPVKWIDACESVSTD